ncbi:MAG: hypothetical protein KJ550_00115, partial [Proteobacteria bacterium]|nr:hypothetical protein [Pseudomonadota bacterium]MBU4011855.1 hypothetical protein [Pseudomonadota bacterium]MBU4127652.1 hypothetical protein [Pseudomonadota bacterium]
FGSVTKWIAIMNLTVNGESEVTRSAYKITEAIRKQPFPWVPTLICRIIHYLNRRIDYLLCDRAPKP